MSDIFNKIQKLLESLIKRIEGKKEEILNLEQKVNEVNKNIQNFEKSLNKVEQSLSFWVSLSKEEQEKLINDIVSKLETSELFINSTILEKLKQIEESIKENSFKKIRELEKTIQELKKQLENIKVSQTAFVPIGSKSYIDVFDSANNKVGTSDRLKFLNSNISYDSGTKTIIIQPSGGGGGGIGGSISTGQIAFGTGTNTIGGDNSLTWDNANKLLLCSNGYFQRLELENPLEPQYGGTGLSSLGSANQIIGVDSTTSSLEYKTIQGTANQINVTHSTGAITLSTPQNIAPTSKPSFLALRLSVNKQTLTGDKTLVAGIDPMYQILDPGTANRTIYLDTTSATIGDRFVIMNDTAYSNTYYLNINQGATLVERIYAKSIREYVFDGTNWISGSSVGGSNTNSSFNVSIGYNAISYAFGVTVGAASSGASSGVAIGYSASGYSQGVAIGRDTRGFGYGVAVGYRSGYSLNTSANRLSTLIGAYSGYQITTGVGNIMVGYGAGYDSTYSPTTGSYNILIGYNAWTPSTSTSNFLNIGGLIFGTELSTTANTISTGNVGIRTTAPNSALHVNGSFAVPITTTTSNYTLSSNDYSVLANASSGAITITLPTASGIAGRIYVIKKIDSSANAVTITPNTGQTIDGANSYALSTQYKYVVLQSTGSNWVIIGNN
jgi:prefoldin subunit 5